MGRRETGRWRAGLVTALVLAVGSGGATAASDVYVAPRGTPIPGLPGVPVIATGADANTWMGIPPPTQPFDDGLAAGVVRTTAPVEYYVRVYTLGATGPVGGWVMRAAAVRGLTPEQIRDRFALPYLPDHVTNVLIPGGTCLLGGIAGPITGTFPANPPAIPTPGPWGAGGAQQTRVVGVDQSAAGDCSSTAYVSANAYINRRALGANALWYAPVVVTGNPAAVGAYLDRLPAPAEYSGLFDAYNILDVRNDGTATALRPALRELAGEPHAAALWVALGNADRFARGLAGQARATLDTPAIAVPQVDSALNWVSARPEQGRAGSGGDPGPADLAPRGRWWLVGSGGFGKVDGDQDRSGWRQRGAWSTLGWERAAPDGLAGLAMSFETTDVVVDGVANRTAIETLRIAGYGAGRLAGLTVGAVMAASWDRFDTSRSLPTFGTAAAATADGWSVAVAAEASRAVVVGGVRIAPTVGLDVVGLSRPGFTESGAGDLALVAEPETAVRLAGRLGGTVTAPVAVAGAVLQPWLRAFWAHDLLDRRGALTAGLRGATAPGSFTVLSADLGRDTVILGAGARLEISPTAAVLIAWDGEVGAGGSVHAIKAGGSLRW